LEKEKILSERLNSLAAKIVELARTNRRVTISELEIHTVANRNTLKVELRRLVKEGYLIICGKGPATWYVLK
jgi:predicted HTH transcriptional regulator